MKHPIQINHQMSGEQREKREEITQSDEGIDEYNLYIIVSINNNLV